MENFSIILIVFIEILLLSFFAYYILTLKKDKNTQLSNIESNSKFKLAGDNLSSALFVGLILSSTGLGFLCAFLADEYIFTNTDNPAVYPGIILIFVGLGQMIFYLINEAKK